nr:transposase [Saprospiraceae bacterium]
MMKKTRRKFDKSFKLEVVRRSLEETTVKALADELDIHPAVISKWRKGFLDTEDQQVLFTGNGNESLTDEQRKIKELQSALKDKDLEVEILKKAISIFSKRDNISTNSYK